MYALIYAWLPPDSLWNWVEGGGKGDYHDGEEGGVGEWVYLVIKLYRKNLFCLSLG
jgi:hypothetical protein